MNVVGVWEVCALKNVKTEVRVGVRLELHFNQEVKSARSKW